MACRSGCPSVEKLLPSFLYVSYNLENYPRFPPLWTWDVFSTIHTYLWYLEHVHYHMASGLWVMMLEWLALVYLFKVTAIYLNMPILKYISTTQLFPRKNSPNACLQMPAIVEEKSEWKETAILTDCS